MPTGDTTACYPVNPYAPPGWVSPFEYPTTIPIPYFHTYPSTYTITSAGLSPPEPRLSDEDVERIAEAVARKLRPVRRKAKR